MNAIVLLLTGFVSGYALAEGKRPKLKKALPPPAKEPILLVSTKCSTWQVIDQSRLDLTFLFIYARERLRGVTSPLTITNAILADIVGECVGTTSPPRNLGEYELVGTILSGVMQDIQADVTLTPQQKAVAQAEAEDWALANAAIFS